MPLRAIIENKEIISSFLTLKEWEELKKRVKDDCLDVIIYQTQKRGYLRRSKKGLQHFVHKKGEKPENWKPESPQHLYIKNEILLGCKDAGWNACPEFKENDWIADVLATKGNNRIAFEVQWSPQTYEKTFERQCKYSKDGVKCCWLFKNPPPEFREWNDEIKAKRKIPIFLIFEDENKEIKVRFQKNILGVREFIKKLLDVKIKFSEQVKSKTNQEVTVNFFNYCCWKCNAEQHAYFLPDKVLSKCNLEIELPIENDFRYNPEIIKAVRNFTKTEKGRHIHIGKIEERYSKTVRSSYVSFGCYKCNALFGEHFLRNAIQDIIIYDEHIETQLKVVLKKSYIIKEQKHWCYKEDKDQCCK